MNIEEITLTIDPKNKSEVILDKLIKYMQRRGLIFAPDGINLLDSSPYGILKGGSSVGFRKRRRISPEIRKYETINKIVLYCTDIDASNIERVMHKQDLENLSDKERTHCYIFAISEFPEAVDVLLENSLNK